MAMQKKHPEGNEAIDWFQDAHQEALELEGFLSQMGERHGRALALNARMLDALIGMLKAMEALNEISALHAQQILRYQLPELVDYFKLKERLIIVPGDQ